MQNTLSQSGNDSKWFSKKIIFRIGMWNSRPTPPFIEKSILNFHFDYLTPSLKFTNSILISSPQTISRHACFICGLVLVILDKLFQGSYVKFVVFLRNTQKYSTRQQCRQSSPPIRGIVLAGCFWGLLAIVCDYFRWSPMFAMYCSSLTPTEQLHKSNRNVSKLKWRVCGDSQAIW